MNIEFIVAADYQLLEIQKLAKTIWPRVFGEILSMEQLDYMLDLIYSQTALERQKMEGQVFVLVKKDNQFIGFLAYQVFKERTKIHKLYLLPEEHGNGYGIAMINFVIDIVKAIPQSILYLNVNKYNKAKLFYEKFGFILTAEEVIDIGKGYVMDDFVMTYEIK